MANLTKIEFWGGLGGKKVWPAAKDVIFGKAAALEAMLDTGLSADSALVLMPPNNVKVSLLVLAIQSGQRAAVKALLAHDANVNVSDSTVNGTLLTPNSRPGVEEPLAEAASLGEDDVVFQLLKRGANIKGVELFKAPGSTLRRTALQRAVSANNVSTVYLLLTHGADVNSAFGGAAPFPVFTHPVMRPPPSVIAMKRLLVRYGYKMPRSE